MSCQADRKKGGVTVFRQYGSRIPFLRQAPLAPLSSQRERNPPSSFLRARALPSLLRPEVAQGAEP
jgi:hypothetical protein